MYVYFMPPRYAIGKSSSRYRGVHSGYGEFGFGGRKAKRFGFVDSRWSAGISTMVANEPNVAQIAVFIAYTIRVSTNASSRATLSGANRETGRLVMTGS